MAAAQSILVKWTSEPLLSTTARVQVKCCLGSEAESQVGCLVTRWPRSCWFCLLGHCRSPHGCSGEPPRPHWSLVGRVNQAVCPPETLAKPVVFFCWEFQWSRAAQDWLGQVGEGVRRGTARGSLEAASDRGGHWCLHRIPGAASWPSPKRVSVFPLIPSSLFPLPSFQQILTSLNPRNFFCHVINRVTFCCLQPNCPKNDQRQLGSPATQPLLCPSKLRWDESTVLQDSPGRHYLSRPNY